MILTRLTNMALCIFLILIVIEKSVEIKILADVLPQPTTCYHIVCNVNEISTISFDEIRSKNIPIIITNFDMLLMTKTFLCDIYLIIFDDTALPVMGYKDNIFQKLNEHLPVDTKVIFIHNVYNLNSKIQSGLKIHLVSDIYLNIIIIEVLLKERTESNKIVQLDILGPFANKIKIFKRKDLIRSKNGKYTSDYLEDIFRNQIWNPIQRNTTLEVAYRDYSILIYSEDKEIRGLEYRIIKELSRGWRMETRSIREYVTTVIPFIYLL